MVFGILKKASPQVLLRAKDIKLVKTSTGVRVVDVLGEGTSHEIIEIKLKDLLSSNITTIYDFDLPGDGLIAGGSKISNISRITPGKDDVDKQGAPLPARMIECDINGKTYKIENGNFSNLIKQVLFNKGKWISIDFSANPTYLHPDVELDNSINIAK